MTKKTITISIEGRNNFHNARAINVRVDPEKTIAPNGNYDRRLLEITANQAHRLQRHFCGIADCTCGSGPVIEIDHDRYAIAAPAE